MGEDAAADPTQAPIIKLVQAMIAEAVRNRASDIHIEPMNDRVRVRYRIDGECLERDRIPLRMKGAADRAHEDHGRHRHRREAPAAGRPHQDAGRQAARSTSASARCPAYHGESCVLRILRPDIGPHRHSEPRLRGGRLQDLPEDHPPAQRHLPGHRADRLGQDHDAVRGPERAEPPRPQDHHRRRPGRIQLPGHQPVPGAARTSA